MELLVKSEILFKDEYSYIVYDASSRLICITSQVYQQLDHIKLAFTEVLKAIRAKKATRLLVDNTEVKGSFTDATEWVTGVFIPQALSAGIVALASIPSKDVFGKFAGTKTLNGIQGVKLQRFTHKSEALAWVASL